MRIVFTNHAILRVRERKISLERIVDCIFTPNKIIEQNEKSIFFKYYSEEKKLLETVCVIENDMCRIITVIITYNLNRFNR